MWGKKKGKNREDSNLRVKRKRKNLLERSPHGQKSPERTRLNMVLFGTQNFPTKGNGDCSRAGASHTHLGNHCKDFHGKFLEARTWVPLALCFLPGALQDSMLVIGLRDQWQ